MTFTLMLWATEEINSFNNLYITSLLTLGSSNVYATCIVQPDISTVTDPGSWTCSNDDTLTLEEMAISPSAGCTTDTIDYSYVDCSNSSPITGLSFDSVTR